MARGSVTVTEAPCSCICAATLSAGESRTSSLCGLNAAPRTAICRPTMEPPHSSRARSTIRTRRRMLIASTSRRKVSAWSAPSSPARAMKARMSLGRQPPPNPRPALRNAAPDPLVQPDRVGQPGHVGPGGLTQLGHRVDEGDLGGQERVRGDLDQLRGRQVGDDLGRAVAERDGVHRVQLLHGGIRRGAALDAVHEPIGSEGVLDGVALAEELRVPQQGCLGRRSRIRSARSSAVPTGTVDLPTTRSPGLRCGSRSSTAAYT